MAAQDFPPEQNLCLGSNLSKSIWGWDSDGIHAVSAPHMTRAELGGGLGRSRSHAFPLTAPQRWRMTRVGRSGAISLPSSGVTNPFVQGHKGNHKSLVRQQLCLCFWDTGTPRVPRAVSLTLPRVLGGTPGSAQSCHPVRKMYGRVSVNGAVCHAAAVFIR